MRIKFIKYFPYIVFVDSEPATQANNVFTGSVASRDTNLDSMNGQALPPAETNLEAVEPQLFESGPPVLKTVFKAIVVETVKDFFGSIIGFFAKYIKHFLNSFRYFWSPTIRRPPFDKMDYKENSNHAFELSLLVIFAIIFLVKLDLIPPTPKETLDLLNNDIWQMLIQFGFFVILAIMYLILIIFSLFFGRLFRVLFRKRIQKKESDILSIYLGNSFFSVTTIIAFIIRCSTSVEFTDSETLGQSVAIIIAMICFVLISIWVIRFAIVNKLAWWKALLYLIFALPTYLTLYVICGSFTAIVFMFI